MALKFTKLEKPITLEGITFDEAYVYDNILIHMADATVKSILVNDARMCYGVDQCSQLFALREVAQNFIDARIQAKLKEYISAHHIHVPFPQGDTNSPPAYLDDVATIFTKSYKDIKYEVVGDYTHFSSPGTISEDIFLWGYTEKDVDNYYPFRLIGHFGVGLKETMLVLLYTFYHKPMSMVMSFGGHVYTLAYSYKGELKTHFHLSDETGVKPPEVEKSNPVLLRGTLPAMFKGVRLVDGEINFFVRNITSLPTDILYPDEHNVYKPANGRTYVYHDGLLAGYLRDLVTFNTGSVTTDQYRTHVALVTDEDHSIPVNESFRNLQALIHSLTDDDLRRLVKIIVDSRYVDDLADNGALAIILGVTEPIVQIIDNLSECHDKHKYEVILNTLVDEVSGLFLQFNPGIYLFDWYNSTDISEEHISRPGIYIGPAKGYSTDILGLFKNVIDDIVQRLNARLKDKGYTIITIQDYIKEGVETRLIRNTLPVFGKKTPDYIKIGAKLGEYLLSFALYLFNLGCEREINFVDACKIHSLIHELGIDGDTPYVYKPVIPEKILRVYKDQTSDIEDEALGVTISIPVTSSDQNDVLSKIYSEVKKYIVYASPKQLEHFVGDKKYYNQLVFLSTSIFLHEAMHYIGCGDHGTSSFEYFYYLFSQALGLVRSSPPSSLYAVHNVINLAYFSPGYFLESTDFHELSNFFVDPMLMERHECDAVLVGNTLKCVNDDIRHIMGLEDVKVSHVSLSVDHGKVLIEGIENVERLPLVIE